MRQLARRWPILGLISVMILTACGGNPTAATPDPTAPSAAPTTSAPTAASKPATVAPPTASPATVPTTAAPTAAPKPTAPPAPTVNPADQLQYGVVTHLYYADRQRVMDLVGFGNFDWVRQQVPWKDTEKADHTCGCEELDQIIEAIYSKNKKVLLSIAKSPDFATGSATDNGLPKDPQLFANFVTLLLNRYKGKIQAIEVWNEQNLAVENGGNVTPADASRYVELLKAAYTAIKKVDPSVIVVAGGLSSTGVNDPSKGVDDLVYLKAMYAYNNGEVGKYFDVQGFHPSNTLHSPDENLARPKAPPARAGATTRRIFSATSRMCAR